jgi:glycosyltransferase involved in cell wall biosynthesis
MNVNGIRAVWVNPCFLDYRVPVYSVLDEMLGGNLTVIFSAKRTPDTVQQKIKAALGSRAVALAGEHFISLGSNEEDFANVGFNLPYQPGLVKAIMATQSDILISEGFFQWTPAALWVKLRKRVPMVITYERTSHTERNAGTLRTIYRRMIVQQIDAICCNGILSKEYCTTMLRMPSERVATGVMAADTEGLAARCSNLGEMEIRRTRAELGLVSPIFLFVGKLVRRKGLRELLESWENYTKQTSSTLGTLLLVGDGPERSVLDNIIHSKDLPNVVFAGAVDYDKIPLYYAMSDVFVMPTLEDNWSLVVPEAMACGKPILCSKYNGCWPELVQEGINGWVFNPLRPEELAELFKKCREHTDVLREMGKRSAEIVQKYSPRCAAEAVLNACLIALHRKSSA